MNNMSTPKKLVKCLSLFLLVSNMAMAQDNTTSSVNSASDTNANGTVIYGTSDAQATQNATYVAPSNEEKQSAIDFVSQQFSKVKQRHVSDEDKQFYQTTVNQLLNSESENNQGLQSSQFIIVVDRAIKRQLAILTFWDYENKNAVIIGYTPVSTGLGNVRKRKDYFFTPTGLFENSTDNPSYRALGTKNENGIRGIGAKGSRVWDFGWQKAQAGWRKNFIIDIRMEMHATDPDYLEQRLGTPQSEGCVRIHQTFNRFLDKYGIIDKNYEDLAKTKDLWVLKKDREPVKLAGKYINIIDTSQADILAKP
jgi:hypothetical protein